MTEKPLKGAALRKAQMAAIRVAAKGTPWQAKQGVLFRQVEEWFIAGHLRNVPPKMGDVVKVEIMAKPMALDPILWKTMGIVGNEAMPLSFRYWGAFVCGTPVLDVREVPTAHPDDLASSMIETLDDMLPALLKRLASERFSDMARHPVGIHDNWRMEDTIMLALRLETNPEPATKVSALKSFR